MNYKLRNLVMVVIACSFAAGSSTEAALTDNARLSIRRAADFGTDIYLTLFIDGHRIATLGPNEGYEATVRPGRHILTVKTTPNPYGNTVFSSNDVNMERGQTYAFTAVWGETDRATLDNSDARVVRLIRNISHN